MGKTYEIKPFDSPPEPTLDWSEVEPYIGKLTPPRVPLDEVSESDIRHWCEVMQDANPLYSDTEYARNSEYGGMIAPPAMVQSWSMMGMGASMDQYRRAVLENPDDPHHKVNAALEKLRQPVSAAINGPAMGGGMELAISCTLRVIAESAKMALPEVKLGIIPGTGGTQRLPRLIGKGRAAELLLTGVAINACDACDIGLVNKVAPDNKVVEAAEELARRIMANAPIAVEMAKDALEVGKDLPLEHAVQYSQKNCVTCFSTEDMKEGMTAFLEKRKSNFKGK